MSKAFEGRTEEVEVPFLTADKWAMGSTVTGKIVEIDESKDFGRSYTLELDEAVEVGSDGKRSSVVKLGNLSGFDMAVRAAMEKQDMPELREGVLLTVECTGVKKSRGRDVADRPNFRIGAVFPDF